MALVRPHASHALATVAGIAGGGGWAMWALHAAKDPQVQELASAATAVGAQAVDAAVSWFDDSPSGGCCTTQQRSTVGTLMLLAIILVNVGSFFLLRWQMFSLQPPPQICIGSANPERFSRSPSGAPDLARIAQFIDTGGGMAVSQTALELRVSEEAVREWWVAWQSAHRGPRRP